MTDGDSSEGRSERAGDLAAGDFSSWVSELQLAIDGEGDAHVPCAGCTACCTSSQFIHIGPDEADTLAHVPAELLFPAPRLPHGHVLLGYDQRGQCPMLLDNRCSIYEHRPRTCRTYDCRIFPATGVELDDDEKELIAHQARRWQFSFPTATDRSQHEAVRAAARFLRDHPAAVSEEAVPANATQRAVLAIEVHDAFLRRDPLTNRMTVFDPEPGVIQVEVRRRTRQER
jgi:Fe-S-cluster containining protein